MSANSDSDCLWVLRSSFTQADDRGMMKFCYLKGDYSVTHNLMSA